MLIHKAFAVPKVLDEQSGNILRMRRYTRLQTAPVPVNPAMLNPPAQQLTAIDIDAQISWYGTYVIITKEVTLINEDPVLNEAAARLGQSLDILGDLKSFVMDSELLPSNVGDNEAQATEMCAA